MPDPTPGEIAYGMYQRRLHNLEEHIPLDYPRPFRFLSAAQQAAWEAAAQAVQWETCQRALAVVRHWNEFGPEYDFAEKIDGLERWLATQPLPAGEEPSHD